MAMFDLSGVTKVLRGGNGKSLSQTGLNVASQGFPKILYAGNFTGVTTSTTSAYTAGGFFTIGVFTVPAQQAYTFGYGSQEFPDNQGYLYVLLKDSAGTPATVSGTVRFAVADNNTLNTIVVADLRTDILAGSQTLKTQQVALPKQGPEALFNDKLIIQLNADTSSGNGTISLTNSTLNIPVTLRAPA